MFHTENILENDSKSTASNDEDETTHTKSADVTLGNGDDADVTLGNGDDTDVTLDNSDTDSVESDVTAANFANDSDTDSVTTLVESGADKVQRLQGKPPGGSSGLATILELCQKYIDFIVSNVCHSYINVTTTKSMIEKS